jgi:transposase
MDKATHMLARHEAEIATLRTLLAEREFEISNIKSKLLCSDLEIEKLKSQLAKLRRMTFGKSSEKLTGQIEQLELALEELETARANSPVIVDTEKAKCPNPARKPLPDHLPRTDVEHLPDTGVCAYPACERQNYPPPTITAP